MKCKNCKGKGILFLDIFNSDIQCALCKGKGKLSIKEYLNYKKETKHGIKLLKKLSKDYKKSVKKHNKIRKYLKI